MPNQKEKNNDYDVVDAGTDYGKPIRNKPDISNGLNVARNQAGKAALLKTKPMNFIVSQVSNSPNELKAHDLGSSNLSEGKGTIHLENPDYIDMIRNKLTAFMPNGSLLGIADLSQSTNCLILFPFMEFIITAVMLCSYYTFPKSAFLSLAATASSSLLSLAFYETRKSWNNQRDNMVMVGTFSSVSMMMFLAYHTMKHPKSSSSMLPMNGLESIIVAMATYGIFNMFQ